jgi:hypothetical protein
MKAIQSFANVRITHPATQHHIPEELDLQHHCCENLIFGMMLLVWQHTTPITLLYIGACNWLCMSECTEWFIQSAWVISACDSGKTDWKEMECFRSAA